MLLAIDAGNTNIVFGIFEQDVLLWQWKLATNPQKTADEYGLFLTQLMDVAKLDYKAVNKAIISTVVPATLFDLTKLCKQYFSCDPIIVGDKKVKTGIDILIDKPNELGVDRIVNSVATKHLYGGNVITVDFGTATTFDITDKNGAYIGGVIAPGVNLSIEALHRAAAKLPMISVERPPSVIAKNTVQAMQSGIFWGYISLIEGIIDRIKAEMGAEKMTIIATGGLAPLFVKATDRFDKVNSDLNMYGLYKIFEMNE